MRWGWVKYVLWMLLATPNNIECCIEEERVALLELNSYIKSHEDQRHLYYGWLETEIDKYNCCAWERVHCNQTTNRVTQLDLDSIVTPVYKYYKQIMENNPWRFNVTLFRPFIELINLDLSNNGLTGLVENDGSTRISTLKNLKVLKLDNNMFELLKLGSLISLEELTLRQCYLNNSNFPFQEITNLRALRVLNLSLNNFQGLIQELTNLRKLQVLDLSNNQHLNGSIHGLCELKNLQELYLSQNQFSGGLSSCLSNLTSMRVIDISYNYFEGNLSSNAFGNLIYLENLDLSCNNFQGKLSLSSFANHSKLQVLKLSGNRLDVQTEDSSWVPTFQLQSLGLQGCSLNNRNGNIPKFLSYQYNLTKIDLSDNGLHGDFPVWLINNNSKITALSLRNNSLGVGGYFRLPDQYANLPLQELDISNNKLQGKLPENIGMVLPQLKVLNMSWNCLEGDIPASMGKMTQLWYLDFSHNNFSGELPTQLLSNCDSLNLLLLSNNNLQGDIISEHMNLPMLIWLQLNSNNFSGTIKNSLKKSSELMYLDISNNKVTGGLPSWIGYFSNMKTLSISNNSLQGVIPRNICQLYQLSYLDLSWNDFTGSIPSCTDFSSLNFLYLHKNSLTGPIPNALSTGLNLATLDLAYNQLSGSIPPWINKLSSLNVLVLRGNNLGGEIPHELCQLGDIDILDLSYNNLSGRIPICFGNMTFGMKHITLFSFQAAFPDTEGSMTNMYSIPEEVKFLVKNQYLTFVGDTLVLMAGLDLSCNKLTGVVPPELGDLVQVHSLNLSHNFLSGSIPSSLSNLKQVESLDLSYNNLSGIIPSQLVDLNFLEIFNVSYNNLTGRTPETGQFGNFDQRNYLGNRGLCGLAVNKSCNPVATNNVMPPSPTKQGGDATLDMEDFFWSFGVSSAIVFIATCVVLCINSQWREAWFDFVGWHVLWWLPYDLF